MKADLRGEIRINEENRAAGLWTAPDDAVTWQIRSIKGGTYDAVLVYDCESGAEGLELEVTTAGSKVRVKLREFTGVRARAPSGHLPLGPLVIPAGESEVSVHAASLPSTKGMVSLGYLELDRGFHGLLKGNDLAGWWHGRKDGGYVLEKETLICPAGSAGSLFTEREYDNFILRFEFRLETGAKSALLIRSARPAPESSDYDSAHDAIRIQIGDEGDEGQKSPSSTRTGSIWNVATARPGYVSKPGEWNAAQVQARGSWIRIELNGAWVVDHILGGKDAELMKRYPGLARTTGHIGLVGRGRAEFRNIRIREITPSR